MNYKIIVIIIIIKIMLKVCTDTLHPGLSYSHRCKVNVKSHVIKYRIKNSLPAVTHINISWLEEGKFEKTTLYEILELSASVLIAG